MMAAATFGVGRLIAIQALNKGETQADSQSVGLCPAGSHKTTNASMLGGWR